jgi:hypothetical protein
LRAGDKGEQEEKEQRAHYCQKQAQAGFCNVASIGTLAGLNTFRIAIPTAAGVSAIGISQ